MSGRPTDPGVTPTAPSIVRHASSLILVLALCLRLPGLTTDFWMDEIWSWLLVWDVKSNSRISGVWGIFTEIHQDNNNYLNTLFLYVCGPAAPVALYRLPALIAGLLTVWLAGRLVTRWTAHWSRSHSGAVWLGMGLLATSEIAVVYSSEARGYALAGCAALATQWFMGDLLRSPRWISAVNYAVAASVGFLSHLSFLPVFLAHAMWSLAALIWSRQLGASWKNVLPRLLLAFGAPSLLVGALWLVDLSRTRVGGGPELIPLVVACDTLSMPFGASLPETYSTGLAGLFAALLLTGLWSVRGAVPMETVGLNSLVIVAPAVLFGMAPQGLVYPRHFLVSMMPLIPVAGVGLYCWVTADRPLLKLAGFLALAVWCLGNGSELVRFYQSGRGQYQAALRSIAATPGDHDILIGSDFDFRNGMVVTFYQIRSPDLQRLIYVPQTGWGNHPPTWILVHDLKREPSLLPQLETTAGLYELRQVFPYAGPIGWHWGTYQRSQSAFIR